MLGILKLPKITFVGHKTVIFMFWLSLMKKLRKLVGSNPFPRFVYTIKAEDKITRYKEDCNYFYFQKTILGKIKVKNVAVNKKPLTATFL